MGRCDDRWVCCLMVDGAGRGGLPDSAIQRPWDAKHTRDRLRRDGRRSLESLISSGLLRDAQAHSQATLQVRRPELA